MGALLLLTLTLATLLAMAQRGMLTTGAIAFTIHASPGDGKLLPRSIADRIKAELFPKPHPYADDPVGWMREVLGEEPISYQAEICRSVADNRRTAVPSCHGPGKSYIASRLIAWWIDVHPARHTRVVWTAPSWDQVDNVIGGELRELYTAHPELGQTIDGMCQITKDGVKVGRGRKPADHNKHGIQGTHRRWVLAIGDEACGLVANITNGLKAITTGLDCRQLLIGNPDDPATEFEGSCREGSGYNVIHINALKTPNFNEKELEEYPEVREIMRELGIEPSTEYVVEHVARSLVGPLWVQEAIRDWGRSGMVFASKVLGIFPDVSKDTLIPPALVTRARFEIDRSGHALTEKGAWGVDIARYGTDRSVVYRNRAGMVRFRFVCGQQSTDTTTGELRVIMNTEIGVPMVIDSCGVGGPVYDYLFAEEMPVVAFDGGSSAIDDRFADARSELYFSAREMFARGLIDLDPSEPNADALANELQEHRFFHTRTGVIRVESKDEIRKRLGHSPDFSDAFVYSLVDPGADLSAYERAAANAPPAGLTDDLMDRKM